MKPAIRVTITGAAGQISYSLITLVSRGAMFGTDQPIILQLLEIEPALPVLKGLCMELEDCSYPLLEKVITTADPMVAFKDADAALLVGSMPRRPGMERKDLLKANIGIFKTQGNAIDKVAKKSIKVVVVGNPANTNCLICSKFAPSIPKENFSALTRLDHNRAINQLALRLNVPVNKLRNAIIWGNHSSTQFADARHALVEINGVLQPVPTVLDDDTWIKTNFLTTVQKRGAAVLEARKASSAMSAAKAIVDHMHDWWIGTPEGHWVSMAVISDGSYGVPEGLIFSFPVTVDAAGKWKIVRDLSLDEWDRSMMQNTSKELEEERKEAMSVVE